MSTHFTSCRNEYDALTLAVLEARKSPCLSKRGAVIWNHGLLIASAHNNQAEPFECTRDALCKSHCGETAIHAEERAIMEALDWTDKEAVKGSQILHVKVNADGQSVYSGSPSCLRCSGMILAAGIAKVWLLHDPDAERGGLQAYSAVEFHALSAQKHGICLARAFDALGEGAD